MEDINAVVAGGFVIGSAQVRLGIVGYRDNCAGIGG
jgi:hypothetical protein